MEHGQKKLTVGSCFSGIGGLELGLEWTGGFETKWQIENDEYASKVLARHWPGVLRFSDIRTVRGIDIEPVDLICGGFPCQDVSLAGARAGLKGERSTLWGEMFRLIRQIRPRWVLAENVPGLFSSDGGQFFGNILRDLAYAGYDAEWGVLSAAGVGAPHLRRRVFILANTTFDGLEERSRKPSPSGEVENSGGVELEAGTEEQGILRTVQEDGREHDHANRSSTTRATNVGHTEVESIRTGLRSQKQKGEWGRRSSDTNWWESEPNVGRVASRVPSRVDRLRCLGNAVVPQVAQRIGEMILNFHLDYV